MRKQQFFKKIGQETGVEAIDAWFGFNQWNMFLSVKQNGHATMPYYSTTPRTKTLFSKANMEAFIELIKSYASLFEEEYETLLKAQNNY